MIVWIIAAAATLLMAVYVYQLVSGPKKMLPLEDFVPVPLIRKDIISHDTRRFVFGLPSKDHILGLPIGQHVSLRFQDSKTEKVVQRSYTPTDVSPGEFSLVIKVYRPLPPKFPDGGLMSQHLDSLNIGDSILMKGPKGHMEWLGDGKFHVKPLGKPAENRVCQQIGMLAGGTGVTPMLQLLHAMFRDDPSSTVKVNLIYANQTEDDILVREELETLQSQYKDRFHLWYTLDRPPADWKYSTGFINFEMVQKHLLFPSNKEGTQFFMCGPPPMLKFACLPALQEAGFTEKSWVMF